MTAIANIDELQVTLGEYLKKVQAGEAFLIMDKGHEIAMLSPVTPERQVLQKMAEEGWARLGSGECVHGASIEVNMTNASLAQAIIEAR